MDRKKLAALVGGEARLNRAMQNNNGSVVVVCGSDVSPEVFDKFDQTGVAIAAPDERGGFSLGGQWVYNHPGPIFLVGNNAQGAAMPQHALNV